MTAPRLSETPDIEAAIAEVIEGQLVCYTLPANYSRPLGHETHADVAKRCAPQIAQALAPVLAAAVREAEQRALREARAEMERVLPWTDFTDAEQQRWTNALDRICGGA